MGFGTSNNNLERAAVPDVWAGESEKPGAGAKAKPPVPKGPAANDVPEDSSDVLARVENQQWADDDAGAVAAPAETPDPEEQVEEPSEEPEEEELPAEEQLPETDEGAALVAPPKKTAEGRIHQLASERRELTKIIERQNDTIARLEAAMAKSADIEARRFEREEESIRHAREAQMIRNYEQELIAQGRDPNAPENIAALEMAKQVGNINQQLEQLKRERAAAEAREATARYVSVMRQNMSEVLKDYSVAPEQRQRFERSAFAIAQAEQLANPMDAVRAALEAVLPMLPKKPGPKPGAKQGTKSTKVDAMTAMRGGRGDATKGQTASGKTPKKTVEQLESEMGANSW